MSAQNQNREKLRYVVFIAVFSALAYAMSFVFPIKVSFLTFDLKDSIITVAAFILGPLAGVLISLLTSFIEMFTSDTGFYGFVMNFLGSAVFSGSAAFVYRYKRTLNGALIGLTVSVIGMTAAMLLFNIFVTPHYLGVPTEAILSMIPSLLLPFNLAKGLLNAAAAMLLYKPVILTLRRAGLMKRAIDPSAASRSSGASTSEFRFNKGSIVILCVALLAIVASVVLLISLNASFA